MPVDLAWSEETRRETKRLMLLIFDKSEASVSWRDLSTKYIRLKKEKPHTHKGTTTGNKLLSRTLCGFLSLAIFKSLVFFASVV